MQMRGFRHIIRLSAGVALGHIHRNWIPGHAEEPLGRRFFEVGIVVDTCVSRHRSNGWVLLRAGLTNSKIALVGDRASVLLALRVRDRR